MGPLNNNKQVEFIEKNINQSVEQGAKIICGGKRAPEFSEGCFFLPTIIECPDRTISTANTELFGPILSVIKFKTEEEAMQIANDNDYGLSSGVFSEDENLKLNNDRKIKAHEHFKIRLNSMDIEKFYLNEPFKNSSETLYRFAPIADELKIQDRDIILNSMILKWKHVTDDLKKNSKNFSL